MRRAGLPSWALMWGLSIAIFAGLKWVTWRRGRRLVPAASVGRSLGYLLLWPGMDAPAFLSSRRPVKRPAKHEVLIAGACVATGLLLFWGAARTVLTSAPLAAGWIGLFGLVFLLHFGAFHLLSIGWRARGVDAMPLMRVPVSASSVGELWSARWNTAFHVLARDYVVKPLRESIGTPAAMMAAFVASGLIHDLVISVPARAGFGLPTAYFLLQGLGIQIERSPLGARLGLRNGLAGRCFTVLVAAIPAFWLFHPAFVLRVVLPFMRVVGAL